MLCLAICDDEKMHRELLKEKLDVYSFQEDVVFRFIEIGSSQELLCTPFDYDILFLDIKLENGINGIDIACMLREQGNNCAIVIVTSLEEYALQGYRADVFRYIVKPIKQEELNEALSALIKKLNRMKVFLQVRCLDAVHYFDIERISLIESYDRRRRIYYDDRIFESVESLESIYRRLPPHQFAYPQKGCIVNLDDVFREKMKVLTMKSGKVIPISRTYLQSFMTALHKYFHSQ